MQEEADGLDSSDALQQSSNGISGSGIDDSGSGSGEKEQEEVGKQPVAAAAGDKKRKAARKARGKQKAAKGVKSPAARPRAAPAPEPPVRQRTHCAPCWPHASGLLNMFAVGSLRPGCIAGRAPGSQACT